MYENLKFKNSLALIYRKVSAFHTEKNIPFDFQLLFHKQEKVLAVDNR